MKCFYLKLRQKIRSRHTVDAFTCQSSLFSEIKDTSTKMTLILDFLTRNLS